MPDANHFVASDIIFKTNALDQVKDIILAVDSQNRVTYLNKAAVKQYGIDREKSIGMKLTNLYKQLWYTPEKEHEAVLSLQEKGYWEGINVHLESNGTKKVVESVVSKIKDAVGNEIGLLSISRDITSRVNVDDWLLESNQRLKYVIEVAGMMVYEIDSVMNEVLIIRGLEDLLGYSIDEVPSTIEWWISQIHPEDRHKTKEQFYPTNIVDKAINEYRIKTKNGEYIYVQGTAKLLTDKSGKAKIVGSMQNITNYKNLEKSLREKDRLAAVGITAGMVGHDIRNPLQAILGDIFLIKADLISECKTEVAESLDSIEKNIGYIDKIVADLQDYAKPAIPEFKKLDLNELIESVFQIVTVPDNIATSIEMDKPITIKSDSTLLKRILSNLISNGIQAMPKGGKLVISASEDGSKVKLIVQDSGVGISEEFKPKIFTPLETTKAKGQGLGLAVVKKFVDALGGNVGFESKVGVGTKFILLLPKPNTV
jgi:PAS domain S-box-containing protein